MVLPRVLGTLDVVLAAVPLLGAEARHARECSASVELWEGRVVIDDPELWTSLWLTAVVALALVRAWLTRSAHVGTSQVKAASISADRTGPAPNGDNCVASLWTYRAATAAYLVCAHVLTLLGWLPSCVYTPPIMYAAVETCALVVSFCLRGTATAQD